MGKLFFKPNWKAINAAILNDEQRKILRIELNDLTKKINQKCSDHYRQVEVQKENDRIKELKNLPVGSSVFYNSRSKDIPFGWEGKKVKDGRSRIVVEFSGKKWSCLYQCIQSTPITDSQQITKNVQDRITNIFNR